MRAGLRNDAAVTRRVGAVRPAVAVALMAAALAAGCGDGPSGPPVLDLEEIQGLYETRTLTFDPQGSPPAANVLAAMESGGLTPITLNIPRQGDFTILFRDPTTGQIMTPSGTVRPTTDGVQLTFATQEDADQFLLPRTLRLQWDEDTGTLSFEGPTQVSRARLVQLFPDLYAGEQLFDPTPGVLAAEFQREGT